jgi:hypothetical protein
MQSLRKHTANLALTLAMLAGILALLGYCGQSLLTQSNAALTHLSTTQAVSQLTAADPTLAATDPHAAAQLAAALANPAVAGQLSPTSSHLPPSLGPALAAHDPTLAAALAAHPPQLSLSSYATKATSTLSRVTRAAIVAGLALLAAALLIHIRRAEVFARLGRRALYVGLAGLLLGWLTPLLLAGLSQSSGWHRAASGLQHVSAPDHALFVALTATGLLALAISILMVRLLPPPIPQPAPPE